MGRIGIVRGAGLLGIIGLLLAGSAYTIGTSLESNDGFCASCHVEPETAYYLASLDTEQAQTLAVFHAGAQTRCIDCHSRRWIPGRVWASLGGLRNWVAFATDQYRSPSVTSRPVGDSGCSKCHSDLTWISERPGHYHSPRLRQRWQAEGGPENTCEVCHPSHESLALADTQFMDNELIEEQCEDCHEITGINE